jgi:hypothetical protein
MSEQYRSGSDGKSKRESNAAKKRDWVYLKRSVGRLSSVVYLDPWQETKKKQAKQWSYPGIIGSCFVLVEIWFMVRYPRVVCNGLKSVAVWERDVA